jgi:molybdopterin converting factor subunit 1
VLIECYEPEVIDDPVRRIQVLYFAALKERVGRASEVVELPASVLDVRSLAAFLEEERPALKGALDGLRFAVGEEFASLDRLLVNGDVVALLPPMSGG